MGADDVKALRDAGHDEAADLLQTRANVAAEAERAEQAKTTKPGTTAAQTPGIRLVDDSAFGLDHVARQEGETMLAAMRQAGIGAPRLSAGPLLDGGQR